MTPAWTGSARAVWAPWAVAGLVVVFGGAVIVMAQDPQVSPVLTALFALLGLGAVLSCVTFWRITVTVDDHDVVVRYGPWHWPVQRIAMADLTSIEAREISPLHYGGWGYRWVPTRRLSGAILRKGPGLVLHRRDGRTFAVTVDDASAALSHVPDHLAHP